ncbi:class I SAM-dependent methyltransferase [Agrobacterium rosae]|uniref:class I SAM-dependent methyltransferase n=1 Tax=Agrobacterium rosae TaxID=1972867 RepID=UPI003BA2C0F7
MPSRQDTKRQKLKHILRSLISRPKSTKSDSLGALFDTYEDRTPSSQNAIDALPGWTSAFPVSQLNAGNVPLFADGRIIAALAEYGSIKDRRVLEIGPLEGMHTYILNQHGPASIDAIEANRSCFLRCLVTKEILGIDLASFKLGDIQKWLSECEATYDFALASGVLYHMPDPGEFLRLVAAKVDAVFIWTHYCHEEEMPVADVRRAPFSGNVEVREVAGMALRYFERSYQHAEENASFCGGMKDRHYWLQKDEIIALLKHLGYNSVKILQEDRSHPGGPCFSLLARH